MRRLYYLAGLLLALGATGASAQSTPAQHAAANGDLLDQLVGAWRIVGQVHGRPAAYAAEGRRVLGGRFVELHMTDVTMPPAYEARVFVGEDTTAGKVLVHWLDNFGAAFSVPAAAGTVSGATIRFEFAYSSGPFRDTFVYHRTAGSWTFRLESGDGTGGWRPFAEYEVQRPEKPAGNETGEYLG
jgi:hypothetical protein